MKAPGHPPAKIFHQRIAPYRLDGAGLPVAAVGFAPAGGLAQKAPVGRLIAGTRKTLGIDKGFQKIDRMAVEAFPVFGKNSGHSTQQVRGHVRHPHPGQNQKTAVVGQKVQVSGAVVLCPADIPVPTADVPRGRRPGKAGDRPAVCPYDVLELFAHRVTVSQIVVVFDQAVEQRLGRRVPNLPNLQRPQCRQRRLDRALVDIDLFGLFAVGQRVVGDALDRRQLDMAFSVQLEHKASADHIPPRPVGLHPVPGLAQLHRQSPATVVRVVCDQFANKGDIVRRDPLAPVCDVDVHDRGLA